MADSELIDFQEALSSLQMSETELQNLVARGDLRAFRSGGTMKFRREDIDGLRSERETEPTIIIPPGEPSLHDSGPLAIDIPEEDAVGAYAVETMPGMGEEPISLDTGENLIIQDQAQSPLDAGLEILPTDDSAEEITIIAPDVVDSGGMMIDPNAGTEAEITIVDEDAAVPVEEVVAGEPLEPERRSVSQRVSSIRHRAAFEEGPGHPFMSALMAVTAAFIFFAMSILFVILKWDIWRPHFGADGGERFVPRYLEGMERSAEKWALPQMPGGGVAEEDVGEGDVEE